MRLRQERQDLQEGASSQAARQEVSKKERPWSCRMSFTAHRAPGAVAVLVVALLVLPGTSSWGAAANGMPHRLYPRRVLRAEDMATGADHAAAVQPQAEQAIDSKQAWREARLSKLPGAKEQLEEKLLNPREADQVALMLAGTDAETRASKMPPGSQVYCPMLKLGRTNDPDQPNPRDFVTAINIDYSMQPMTWEAAMNDSMAQLYAAGSWWSGRAPSDKEVPLTMVTQATVDRLQQLSSQCDSWRGRLSVALYLAVEGSTEDVAAGVLSPAAQTMVAQAAAHVHKFFLETERGGEAKCALDVVLAVEVFTEHKAMMLYPINALRNLARLQARTPLVGLVDVDMLLSHRFYDSVLSDAFLRGFLLSRARDRSALVLPAFETHALRTADAAALADALVAGGKAALLHSVGTKEATPFDDERFPQGHNWTLFDRWYNEKMPYEILYGSRFEPWTIVDRLIAPWHDARFRGYGQNKIVHVAAMNASGFRFVVVPGEAFIVHRAHTHTTMRLRLVASKQLYDVAKIKRQPVDRATIYGHTRELFDKAQEEMAAGIFLPALDRASISGLSVLSWWDECSGDGALFKEG